MRLRRKTAIKYTLTVVYADETKENEEIEMPFDEKVIRLDIPIFGKDNLSDKRESKSEVFIDSDDNNGVLN